MAADNGNGLSHARHTRKDCQVSHLIEVETNLLRALEQIVTCEATGEVPPEDALALFREAALYAAEKRDHVAQALAFLDERAAAMRAKEKELAARRKAIEAAHERLSGYVLAVLTGKGITVAVGAESKLVVTEAESVEVANPDALPDELCRFKTTREPDKVSIRLALERGERIELAAGARIMRRSSLQVKPLAVKDRPGDTLLRGREE